MTARNIGISLLPIGPLFAVVGRWGTVAYFESFNEAGRLDEIGDSWMGLSILERGAIPVGIVMMVVGTILPFTIPFILMT